MPWVKAPLEDSRYLPSIRTSAPGAWCADILIKYAIFAVSPISYEFEKLYCQRKKKGEIRVLPKCNAIT